MGVSQMAYVGLGSNLGDRRLAMEQALSLLSQSPGVSVLRVSDITETWPLAGASQPKYLNAVAEVRTDLDAPALLEQLHRVEQALGRTRTSPWAPRTMDLDLILLGQEVIRTPGSIVPHVEMHLRSFVLTGLAQLNPGLIHPVLHESIGQLLGRLNGQDFVIDPAVPQLVEIAGTIGVGKTTLADRLRVRLGGRVLYEPYATNPFLPEVYAGHKELALDSQLHFLVNRSEQLALAGLESGRLYVADYMFEKERIYAQCLLDARQRTLYEKIYEPFAQRVAGPVLVIFLQDSAGRCLDRIRKRNRPYERGIDAAFLCAIEEGYDQLLRKWTDCPVIRLDVSGFDCLDDHDLDRLASQVVHYVHMQS